jgi:diamine N-acetyltransferase
LAEVVLRDINSDNWEECANLKLRTSQGGLVAPNLFSIAESKVEATFMPLAIYDNHTMVGFIMWGIDPDDGEYWIYRLMVDEKYQGKGFGKAAVVEVLKRLKELGAGRVYVGYKPQNVVAASLFASLGFERTGQMLQGEFIAKLEFE